MDEFSNDIKDAYEEYGTSVSTKAAAAAFEVCTFLMVACETIKPKSVIDLGSGFSSYVLRKYRQKYLKSMEVYSVDTWEKWLNKSREFARKQSVNIGNYLTWDKVKVSGTATGTANLPLPTGDLEAGDTIDISGCSGGTIILTYDNQFVIGDWDLP